MYEVTERTMAVKTSLDSPYAIRPISHAGVGVCARAAGWCWWWSAGVVDFLRRGMRRFVVGSQDFIEMKPATLSEMKNPSTIEH
jgi:hypothetical protein